MMSLEEIVLAALQGGPMTTVGIIDALNKHGKFLTGRTLRKTLLAMVVDGRMQEAKVGLGKKGRLTASVWYLPEHTIGQVAEVSKTANKARGAVFRHASEMHRLAHAESQARAKRGIVIP